jgi:indole-3-glycerol phosphate synthase
MNILETIIDEKKLEVSSKKLEMNVSDLEKSNYFKREILSLKKFLLDETRTGIIAEFKRRSPSKGIINGKADVVKITSAY